MLGGIHNNLKRVTLSPVSVADSGLHSFVKVTSDPHVSESHDRFSLHLH